MLYIYIWLYIWLFPAISCIYLMIHMHIYIYIHIYNDACFEYNKPYIKMTIKELKDFIFKNY